MTILDTIVEHKRIEILKRKQKSTVEDLMSMPLFPGKTAKITGGDDLSNPGIIAEFKRRSPSKGIINSDADIVQVASAYSSSGAVAMSILTDRNFFGGSFRDLSAVKQEGPGIPLLRKDFIIDPYQVYESKAYGADIILLIAAILSKPEVEELAKLAQKLGMQVLLEVHDPEDLEKCSPGVDLVGVNNRNLRDFSVDIGRSVSMIQNFPDGVIPVSESGLSDTEEIRHLYKHGFRLFLVGENFMKEKNPGKACIDFIKQLEE